MQRKNITEKKAYLRREKKLEKMHYRIVIGLMIFFVVYWGFVEPKTIGYNPKHSIIVFWLPVLLGVVLLGIYRRHFLINQFAVNKAPALRAFMAGSYLLQGFLFSFLSFGQLAMVSWDYLNYRRAQNNPEQTIVCNVSRFWNGKRRHEVEFYYNNQFESFVMNRNAMLHYKDKNSKEYELAITARQGIWGYYLVEDWEIKHK